MLKPHVQWIRHRVNKSFELEQLDRSWGVEIDLRSSVNEPGVLHLAHDPWVLGESFEDWLVVFKKKSLQGPIILNTKEDALEEQALNILHKHSISNFFFLDTTVPTLNKWSLVKGERRFAVRLSRIEPAAALQAFVGKVEWLWVDCFDGLPLEIEALSSVSKLFKVCLVSPELQGQPIERLSGFKHLLPFADAICTKNPGRWIELCNLV